MKLLTSALVIVLFLAIAATNCKHKTNSSKNSNTPAVDLPEEIGQVTENSLQPDTLYAYRTGDTVHVEMKNYRK